MTTDRNFEKELCYSKYIDMTDGDDTETIYYPALIGLLNELLTRIEKLEKRLDQQEEQNEI